MVNVGSRIFLHISQLLESEEDAKYRSLRLAEPARQVAYALAILCLCGGLQHVKSFADNLQKIRIFLTRHRSVSQNNLFRRLFFQSVDDVVNSNRGATTAFSLL